ncbi:MAG TPA: hypothetical protein VLT86_01365 [Vicinamibacterales bacterium]|nr:hypothetical protein [Vicinamibacterales bacterium]
MPESPVPAALAAARLRALRTGLLALHKTLLDHERVRYERTHGRIESPGQTLHLVMTDPWFAWLRPISTLVVQADERLDGDNGVTAADVAAFAAQVRDLMKGADYDRALQEAPDVVMAHGRLSAVLSQP